MKPLNINNSIIYVCCRPRGLKFVALIKMECAHLCIIITKQRIQLVSFLSLPCRNFWVIDLCFCTLARGTLHTAYHIVALDWYYKIRRLFYIQWRKYFRSVYGIGSNPASWQIWIAILSSFRVVCSLRNRRYAGSNPATVSWYFLGIKVLSTSTARRARDSGSNPAPGENFSLKLTT